MITTTRLRAAVYCRVSTDGQEENASLPTQEAACRAYASERGFSVSTVYTDVHSGYELWERPKLTILREAMRRGEFDAIICHALDRLSRKQVHTAILVDECERAGVALLFVTEEFERSAVGEFIRSAKSFAAELEREKIKERTQRGMLARMQSGKLRPGAHPMFGYRWRDEAKSGLVIDEATAPIARRIFAEYVAGKSTRAIAAGLNADGIPSPRGKARWSHTGVYQIVTHPGYAGIAVANQYRCVKVQGKASYQLVTRPEAEHIALPAGTIPPLIAPELALIVEQRRAQNKADSPRNARNPEAFLLRGGQVRCAACGKAARTWWHGDRPLYRVERRSEEHHDCPAASIPAAMLDAAAWEFVVTKMADADWVAEQLAALCVDDPTADSLAAIERALADVTRKQGNLTRRLALFDDDETAAPLVAEVASLGRQKRDLLAERDNVLAQRAEWEAAKGRMRSIEEACRHVRARLGDGSSLTYAEKRDALVGLDVRVQLFPVSHGRRYLITGGLPLDDAGDGTVYTSSMATSPTPRGSTYGWPQCQDREPAKIAWTETATSPSHY